ncbi:MAG: hypothetical protein R2788_12210 [Saprospiraceae bacterium]
MDTKHPTRRGVDVQRLLGPKSGPGREPWRHPRHQYGDPALFMKRELIRWLHSENLRPARSGFAGRHCNRLAHGAGIHRAPHPPIFGRTACIKLSEFGYLLKIKRSKHFTKCDKNDAKRGSGIVDHYLSKESHFVFQKKPNRFFTNQ